MDICQKCGARLRPENVARGVARCPDCGASQPWSEPEPARSAPTTATDDDIIEAELVGMRGQSPFGRRASFGEDPTLRLLFPVGRSGLAIAAGYFGLFAVLLVPAPIALLLGILAVRDIRRHPEKHGMGRAIFGIVMGAIGTVGLIVVGIPFLFG